MTLFSKPVDLQKGDTAIIVKWNPYNSFPTKILEVTVSEIYPAIFHEGRRYMHGGFQNFKYETQAQKWVFTHDNIGVGNWDLRGLGWEDYLSSPKGTQHNIFHKDQMKDAEWFIKHVVSQEQINYLREKIDSIQKDFTTKLQMLTTLEENIESIT